MCLSVKLVHVGNLVGGPFHGLLTTADEGYVFTVVTKFVHRGGVCYPSMHCRNLPCSRGEPALGGAPWGVCLLRGDACSGGCKLWGVPALGGGARPDLKGGRFSLPLTFFHS